jgi:hypothetical protein
LESPSEKTRSIKGISKNSSVACFSPIERKRCFLVIFSQIGLTSFKESGKNNKSGKKAIKGGFNPP